MKKILNYLNETVKKEKALLIFVVVIFIIGLVVGSLFVNVITNADKELLVSQVEAFFSSAAKLSSDIFGIKVVGSQIVNNVLQLFIIFVLGASMIGVLAVIFIIFFKGFMLGTTLATIILKYQLKGIIGCFLYVFPVMILNIIIYIIFSFLGLYVSIKFIRALLKKDNINLKKFFGKYVLSFLISVIIMMVLCLLDGYLTPLLLKIFTYLI